jgi:hypothetical protein
MSEQNMPATIPPVSRDTLYRGQSPSTTSQPQFVRNWTTLWIVVAMLVVAAILATILPPASSYGGSIAAPAWVTSL